METNNEYKLIPGFGNSFGTGWRVMTDNFLRLFLVILILAVVAAPFKIFNIHFDPSDIWRSPYNWGYDLAIIFREAHGTGDTIGGTIFSE